MKIDALDKIPDEQPKDHFLSILSAPARRAIENNDITTLEQLSKYSKKRSSEISRNGEKFDS